MSSAQSVVGEAEAPPKTFSRGYRGWLLFVLLLGNVLNLADRQGIAAVAPAFKAELHLSDGQLGVIQGLGFAIFYTLFSLPLALLADRFNRARLISACIAVFGAFAALCGIAQSFWQMLLFRVGVGSGDAGFVAPVSSLLGDHYPPQKRTSAMTVIWLGAPIGAVTGSVLGGWFAQNLGWRSWFFAVSAPAVALAVVALLTLREPPRGAFDPGGVPAGRPPSPMTVLRFLMRKRAFVHVLIGAALAATGMNAIGQFLARFIVATHHVGFAEAGRILGTISGVSMASGLAIGGFGMDWAGKFDRRWYVWGPAIGLALATPLFFVGFAQGAILPMMLVLIAGHVALFVYYTPTLGMAQNMVGPTMRGSSAFVVSLVLGLVGVGLGPTLVGFLSDFFAQQAFGAGDYAALCPGGAAAPGAAAGLDLACKTASGAGIKHAVMAASLLFVWGAVHYLLASRRLRQDLDTHYDPGARA
jgi:predicted MFS family arabinose efflux permease